MVMGDDGVQRLAQHEYDVPYHWCMASFYKYLSQQLVQDIGPWIQDRVVVDIGCGDGFTSAMLADRARKVYGFDLSERALAFAGMIVERDDVVFARGSAAETAALAMSIPEPVEVITAFELIEHLEPTERDTFLGSAHDALSHTTGHLILSTPNRAKRRGPGNPYHVQEYDCEELRALLSAAGFAYVEVHGLYLQPRWPRLEHFADVIPFRALFRRLGRSGWTRPSVSRTLVGVARPKG